MMEYDALGNIVKHENDWASVTLQRNSQGLIREEVTVLKAANGLTASSWRVAQSFNESGKRTSLTLPSGRVIAYSYDDTGRVTSVTNASTAVSYAGSGLTSGSSVLVRFEYAGQRWRRTTFATAGVAITANYDGRAQICERVATDETTGGVMWRAQMLLDSARRAALETVVVEGGSRSRYFSLDVLGRLTGYSDEPAAWTNAAALAPPGHPQDPAASTTQAAIDALIQPAATPGSAGFSYDLVGNRLLTAESGLPAVTSAPDADNRYSAVGGKVWKYDLEGRLLSDVSRSFRYDGDGLVTEEFENVGGSSARTAGLIRDALGRVLAVISRAGVHYFAYADRAPITQFGASGLTEFAPGRFADEPLHVATQGHDPWIVCDALRSPRLLVRRGPSSSSKILSFRPFGASEGAESSAGILGFAGMLQFPGSALLHSMMRSYRADVGRYLQQDPAGFVDGTNRYVYAGNNPIDFFDPLGLQLTPSDHRIFVYVEGTGAALKLDPTHSGLPANIVGMNKHLEMQFAVGPQSLRVVPPPGLSADDAMRIVPELHIDKETKRIVAADMPPDIKPPGSGPRRTVDIGILKPGVDPNKIVGMKAEDALAYVIDYKTGKAELEGRKELEALIGNKPVVKLTGKAGELAKALTHRFAYLAAVKVVKSAAVKKAAKWGLHQIPKAIPILGAIFTYSTAEGSQGERVARAGAGEIGIGPLDLEMFYDFASSASSLYAEQETQRIREGHPPFGPAGP